MTNPKARIQQYLDHRHDRERRILAAWRLGRRKPSDIVEDVYKDVPESMHAVAQRSVLAHLEKLREENRL